ncbi:Hypothetical protein, putative [Bodo saltans]|uniref:Uncharacterized protein n=1 Tax=Bodo saltans TaxID=75058 RepID=A0A0S4KEK5_BODSA|nr:Hypothetical protein, putative [Bodo saltans]|eukprot:CUI13120.1 Hypothetical protein, putative [Bodo saltans]
MHAARDDACVFTYYLDVPLLPMYPLQEQHFLLIQPIFHTMGNNGGGEVRRNIVTLERKRKELLRINANYCAFVSIF